jgi:hypothetical protein
VSGPSSGEKKAVTVNSSPQSVNGWAIRPLQQKLEETSLSLFDAYRQSESNGVEAKKITSFDNENIGTKIAVSLATQHYAQIDKEFMTPTLGDERWRYILPVWPGDAGE